MQKVCDKFPDCFKLSAFYFLKCKFTKKYEKINDFLIQIHNLRQLLYDLSPADVSFL